MVVDGTRSRLDEIVAQQRDLLALKDQLAQQEQADQQQRPRSPRPATAGGRRASAADLEQRLSEVTARLTALDAARERGVGLSLATHDLELAGTASRSSRRSRSWASWARATR